jgi:hypothetical protein
VTGRAAHLLLPALACLVAGSGGPSADAAEPLSYEALARRVAPAVVTVRAVASARISVGDRSESTELEFDGHGVVVHPSGLILVNNTAFGDDSSPMLKRLSQMLNGASITVQVSRVRVQVADEPEEREATLLLRDRTNDLAWVQVLATDGAKPLATLDLPEAPEPRVGQRLAIVSRREARFDHAPSLARCYVAGRLTTPRLLWSLGGDVGDAGSVATDLEGRPAGVLVVQPGADEEDLDVLLLPTAVVRKSRDAALAKAAEAGPGK